MNSTLETTYTYIVQISFIKCAIGAPLILRRNYRCDSKFLSVHYIHAKLQTMMPWVKGLSIILSYSQVMSVSDWHSPSSPKSFKLLLPMLDVVLMHSEMG